MDLTAIVTWIVFGAIVGVIARFLMPGRDPMGWVATILLGIVGSFVGGFLAQLFLAGNASFPPPTSGWIGSIIGAIVLLAIYRYSQGDASSPESRPRRGPSRVSADGPQTWDDGPEHLLCARKGWIARGSAHLRQLAGTSVVEIAAVDATVVQQPVRRDGEPRHVPLHGGAARRPSHDSSLWASTGAMRLRKAQENHQPRCERQRRDDLDRPLDAEKVGDRAREQRAEQIARVAPKAVYAGRRRALDRMHHVGDDGEQRGVDERGPEAQRGHRDKPRQEPRERDERGERARLKRHAGSDE